MPPPCNNPCLLRPVCPSFVVCPTSCTCAGQGTEIKAITYSNMQVQGLEDDAPRKEIFLIVDI
jgi:hypothetical protein